MSSKFFTNRGDNTLENRLKDILTYHDIKYLEFLIGYFRISGFSKIAELMDGIEKARILVGINVDHWTMEAKERGKHANLLDQIQLSERFITEQLNGQLECNAHGSSEYEGLNREPYCEEVDRSVELFASMLSEGRLEIKIAPQKNLHSKIYILRQKEITRHDGTTEQIGSVITGSSNLTANGLQNNFEFNVELRDSDDIAFALQEFEELWRTAVELKPEDAQKIKEESYLKEITPFELYMKFLTEHFEDRIDYDPNLISLLPKGYMRLAYQIDAVNEGISKIKKHNGFFLADVVGLGKTVTTAMIVKKLLMDIKGEVLVIAPPSIQKEWQETFTRFEIGSFRHYKIVSVGKLESIRDSQRYELVIIDESHKFKNYDTGRYKELERICKERTRYHKKVILISATPLNNKPMDIANQLYLFQDKRSSTIPSHPNLESFFGNIDKEYREILKNGNSLTPDQKEKLKRLSKKIRDDILREVMVRRTRTDILDHKMYSKDLKEQGLNIPKVEPVEEIEYPMGDKLVKIFDETVDILTETLKYERYKILYYIKPESRHKMGKISENIFERGSLELAELMKRLLIKRFESSFYAFKSSIRRQEFHLKTLIKMFKEDRILIGSKINIYDLMEEDADDKIEQMLEQGRLKELNADDFKAEYLQRLQQELTTLQKLINMWNDVEEDPKIETFRKALSKKRGEKVVVFTESKETACYLEQKLQDFKVLCVHGANRDKLKTTIRENFDANYDPKKQKNDFDILVTTDTLSEGVNMHRSNIIYNYDIPWNATRLMQRIGRINRIGTPFERIYIYNFIPSAKSDALIELSKKAFVKLQTFHSTFGEDNQIYSTEEEVGSVKLFEELEEEADEELQYLEEIREFKKSNPDKFKAITKLPAKIRVQRQEKALRQTSFVFLKNQNSKSYYRVDTKDCESINFLQMAKHLKAAPRIKGIMPIEKFHYTQVRQAMEAYDREISQIVTTTNTLKVSNATDKKALRLLKSWRDKGYIDLERYKLFKMLIETGRYQNLGKQIKKLEKSSAAVIAEKLDRLSSEYSLESDELTDSKRVAMDARVILSETFL